MVARSAPPEGDPEIVFVFGGHGDMVMRLSLRAGRVKKNCETSTYVEGCGAEREPGCRPARSPSSVQCPMLELPTTGMSLGSCFSLASPLRLSISAQLIHAYPAPHWTLRNYHADHRASSKLFADAEHEEDADQARAAPPRTTTRIRTELEHPNWTGDESTEDAVLRMLVDKYKPLRTGKIRTAEEKMRHTPPQVAAQQPETSPTSIMDNDSAASSLSQSWGYRADEPLLPAVEGHKPWLTTFKVPSHTTASIRHGHFATAGSPSSSEASMRNSTQTGPVDSDRTRRKERDGKKRSEIAGRLTRAKESSLDYRLGITKDMKSGVQARPNPVSIKGWAGLVEERIEVRRKCVALHR